MLLVLFTLTWLAEFYWNSTRLRRVAEIETANCQHWKDRAEAAERALEKWLDRFPSQTAFVITSDGIKALPSDWKQRCFPESKA